MHDFKKFPELTNNQMTFYYFESPHKQITKDFEAKVIKVTDGDTIRVTCDFRDFDFPVRFLRTQAPELDEGGDFSRNWLEKMLLNENITIKIDNNNRVGKWGRLLGEIILDGLNINDLSILLGYAKEFENEQIETFK